MESYSFCPKNVAPQPRAQPQRRTWTMPEEMQLLIGLKDAVARGWKSENGFRTGYSGVLEQHMAQYFPAANIKADPHISSKIHVWKKHYGCISTMLSRSGFGWNNTAHVIEADDDVWDAYMLYDKDARKIRNKAWPYYDDWSMIFGKDRATGEHGTHFGDAVNQVLHSTSGKTHVGANAGNVASGSVVQSDDESEFMSACRGESATNQGKQPKKRGTKRARLENETEPIVKMMSVYFEQNDDKIMKLVEKMASDETEHASMRNKVFTSLDDHHHLSIEEKMKITSAICNHKDFEIFLSTTLENREQIIQLILEGKY